MSRWKQIGIPALAAGGIAVLGRGCKTLEVFHTVDFATHLKDSPTLGKLQTLLGTRMGLAVLIAAIVILGGTVVRLSRERRAAKLVAPPLPDVLQETHSTDVRPRRVRRVIEEHEEVRHTRTVRSLIEEDDP